jgi:hypothetical protein
LNRSPESDSIHAPCSSAIWPPQAAAGAQSVWLLVMWGFWIDRRRAPLPR